MPDCAWRRASCARSTKRGSACVSTIETISVFRAILATSNPCIARCAPAVLQRRPVVFQPRPCVFDLVPRGWRLSVGHRRWLRARSVRGRGLPRRICHHTLFVCDPVTRIPGQAHALGVQLCTAWSFGDRTSLPRRKGRASRCNSYMATRRPTRDRLKRNASCPALFVRRGSALWTLGRTMTRARLSPPPDQVAQLLQQQSSVRWSMAWKVRGDSRPPPTARCSAILARCGQPPARRVPAGGGGAPAAAAVRGRAALSNPKK
jgi:hypothetical protein